KELGITHVHLLPSFDFATVDETKPSNGQYNWGYDPQNYNVPEGSYATDAYNGNVRIREFKQMVKAMHANGLRVVLDVVYNHTNDTEHSV
ncbi:alpha-amylase family glycosyl hydrolase, partial [Undibacterium sp. 10I3]